MKELLSSASVIGLTLFTILVGGVSMSAEISLPGPSTKGTITVEEALKSRRTHRSFRPISLTLQQFSQILWGAYGISGQKHGTLLKTAPSAGALYPLDLYAVVGKAGVESLDPGVYHFRPESQGVELLKKGDLRVEVARRSLAQMWMAEAPFMLVITGEYVRSSMKYGNRGVTYTHIETGHVGQNVFLQAEAMGLAAGIVGAFDNEQVIDAIGLPTGQEPLVIMPVGHPR